MITDPAREQLIARSGLRPVPGARQVTNAQIERARGEARQRRAERILAVNDAVAGHMRDTRSRNYPAAFQHIARTRPELFADMQALAPERLAGNGNPYHDDLGRFTTGGGAAGKKDDGLDGKGGGQTKPASIRNHVYDSRDFPTCVVASIRSLIATRQPSRVPSEDDIKAQIAAAAKGIFTNPQEGVKWDSYGMKTTAQHFGAIVQQMLANNGVVSTFQTSYASMQQLSDALIRSGQPAMINLHREGAVGAHSVAVQWDPEAAGGEGRFLINNVSAKGYTDSFTKQQFESGKIYGDIHAQASLPSLGRMRFQIMYDYTVVITK